MKSKTRKRLGQNFLVDAKAIESIASAVPLEGVRVLEIGAGTGNLTKALAKRALWVVAVEKDPLLIPVLRNALKDFKNVEIVYADILDFDISKHKTFFGSLPYYLSSPILFKVLRSDFEKAVFVLQKEFAERLVAKPNSADWSRLSAMAQSLAEIEIVSVVPRISFKPMPKIDSAAVAMQARKKHYLNEELIATLFQHKNQSARKALLHSSGSLKIPVHHLKKYLSGIGELASKRVRTLELAELEELSKKWKAFVS